MTVPGCYCSGSIRSLGSCPTGILLAGLVACSLFGGGFTGIIVPGLGWGGVFGALEIIDSWFNFVLFWFFTGVCFNTWLYP